VATIRTRILSDFLVLIVLMGIVGGAFILANRSIQREQQRHDDVLYAEFGLIEDASAVARAFNAYRLAPRAEAYTVYTAARAALTERMDRIVRAPVVGGNRPALVGVKNLLASLVTATDDGVRAVEERDLSEAVVAQDRIGRISAFVEEAVSTLILEELALARNVRQATERRGSLALGISSVILAAASVAGAWYASRISRRISAPLTELTVVAGSIAHGSYGTRVDERLRRSADEIGSLARSFDSLSVHLQETVGGLQAANEATRRTLAALESKNVLLEKLNAAFVVREGRINELKNEIVRLGGTVASRDEDGGPAGGGAASGRP